MRVFDPHPFFKEGSGKAMSKTLEKWKGTRTYGLCLLLAMLLFFYLVFKILTPNNFGSPSNLYAYLQSSIIYSVGGCGLYFIVVMGLFDFAVGANIVLSSIVGVILSKHFGYAGFILGCLGCGTLIGFLIGIYDFRLVLDGAEESRGQRFLVAPGPAAVFRLGEPARPV